MANRYVKGLNKDSSHMDQPEGTWRHAKNAIINRTDGGISNEGGISNLSELEESALSTLLSALERCIGKIEISDGRVVFFTVTIPVFIFWTDAEYYNNIENMAGDGNFSQTSSIYLLHNSGELELVLTTSPNSLSNDFNLKFNRNNPISGTYKIDSEQNLNIYWTDNLNYPRSLNVTRQLASGSTNRIYGINPLFSPNKNYIDRINLFPHSGPVPNVEFNKIIPGGGLLTGAYYLAVAYVDEDLIQTNYLTSSMPISITEESQTVVPIERHDGAPPGSASGKSIRWTISNINTDYDYLRPAIIRVMGGAIDAFKLKDTPIALQNDNTMHIAFTGLEGYTSASLQEVMIDTASYDTVKTMEQLDGVLYLGNLSGTKDVGYQKYANFIKLNAVTKVIKDFDPFELTNENLENGYASTIPLNGEYDLGANDDGSTRRYGIERGYRSPNLNVNYRGYTRDEVYAFYIAFILNDGSMSYAYHIPGRATLPPQQNIREIDIIADAPFSSIDDQNRSDSDDYLFRLTSGEGRQFHFYDFSFYTGANNMNFWQNANEFYPDTDNYDVVNAEFTGTPYPSLRGTNVRHHHFPSNENRDFSFINVDSENVLTFDEGNSGEFGIIEDEIAADQFYTMEGKGAGKSGLLWYFGDYPYWDTPDGEEADYFIAQNLVPGNELPEVMPTVGDCVHCQIRNDTGHGQGDSDCYPQMTNGCEGNNLGAGWVYGVVSDVTPDDLSYIVIDPTASDCECSSPTWWQNNGWNGITSGCYNGVDGGSDCSGNWYTTQEAPDVWGGCFGNHFINDYHIENMTGHRGDGPINGSEGGEDVPFKWRCRFKKTQTLSDVQTDGHITRDVNILGFQLKDLKVPGAIANKTQGFRIYYAKRAHHNRRILGQNPAIPMAAWEMTPRFCGGELNPTDEDGEDIFIANSLAGDETEIFWAKINTLWNNDKYNGTSPHDPDYNEHQAFSFHDFYLLNSHNNISHATHVKMEFVDNHHGYLAKKLTNSWPYGYSYDKDGNIIADYNFTTASGSLFNDDAENNVNWPLGCLSQKVFGAFYISKGFYGTNLNLSGYANVYDIFDENSGRILNRPIKENSKTYIPGDTILKAKDLGFGYNIYNEHGESSIIFELEKGRGLPFLDNDNTWVTIGDADKNGIKYLKDKENFNLWHINLHAFKLDLYNDLDTNDLIWTGYQVVGKDYDKYIVDKGTSFQPLYDLNGNIVSDGEELPFTTRPIFGGDTIISRHSWRSTIRIKHGVSTEFNINKPEDERNAFLSIVESTDNINFRNQGEKALQSDAYAPVTPFQDILAIKNDIDLTLNMGDETTGNIRYNEDYSLLNNIRTTVPLPTRFTNPDTFTTRVHRSVKDDTASLIDNYRIHLANQYKNLPKNRGELWSLAKFNNLLFFHMEDTIYKSKGKEALELKDGTEAFLGSGDIFEKDPEEVMQTDYGYGGSRSQYASITTRYGYFWVNQFSKKVFLLSDNLYEISGLGMRNWFQENLPFKIQEYGPSPSNTNFQFDNPFKGMGFTSTWDPENKRILLTKTELVPTKWFEWAYNNRTTTGFAQFMGGSIFWDEANETFVAGPGPFFYYVLYNPNSWSEVTFDEFEFFPQSTDYLMLQETEETFGTFTQEYCDSFSEEGVDVQFISGGPILPGLCFVNLLTPNPNVRLFEKKGWTISFYPELQIWVSFHDYTPSVYMTSLTSLFSFKSDDERIWTHNTDNFGLFYFDDLPAVEEGTRYPFSFEFIHSESKNDDKTFYNIGYVADVFKYTNISQESKKSINNYVKIHDGGFTSFYVYNTHQISGEEDINYLVNTRRVGNTWKINKFRDMAKLEASTDNYYVTGQESVVGTNIVSVETTSVTEPMFNISGMDKEINPDYIDLTKTFDKRRKFNDKFLGICLKNDNSKNNLVTLYSTEAGLRKYFR